MITLIDSYLKDVKTYVHIKNTYKYYSTIIYDDQNMESTNMSFSRLMENCDTFRLYKNNNSPTIQRNEPLSLKIAQGDHPPKKTCQMQHHSIYTQEGGKKR